MAYHYVSASASGAGNGTSWANAWTTLESVNWSSIGPGDTLWISGGVSGATYTQEVWMIVHEATTEGDRIWIKSGAQHPTDSTGHSGRVTIEGRIQLGDNLAHEASYVTIDGEFLGTRNIRQTGSAAMGIDSRYSDTQAIVLRYLEIDSNGNADNEHGVKVGAGGRGWIIEHCWFHDNYLDCINTSSSPYEWGVNVARYNIFDLRDDGMQVGSGWDIYGNVFNGTDKWDASVPPYAHSDAIQGVAGYFRIYNNKFLNCGQSVFIEAATGFDHIQHIHIWNNLFYDDGLSPTASGVGILLRWKLPDNGTNHVVDDIRIQNNTFANLTGIGLRMFHSLVNGGKVVVPEGAIRYENNINYKPTLNVGVDAGFTDAWPAGCWVMRNNIFYLAGGGMAVQFQGTTYSSAATLNAHADAEGNLNVDPGFVADPTDLRLAPGSPAIGAGYDLSAFFTDAYGGDERTGAFDIGAFAYGASGGDTTPPTPNPSTVASVTVNSTTQITVVADTATDAVSSPVEYNHSIGGVFQGWQSSATRVFTGLLPGTLYSFSVRARDSAGNATTASVASTATTDASETTTPNPLAFRSNAMLAMGSF